MPSSKKTGKAPTTKAPSITGTPVLPSQDAPIINPVSVAVPDSEKPLTGKALRLANKAARLNARMGGQHVAPRIRAEINDRAVKGTIRYNDAPIISDDNILELDKRIRAGDAEVIRRIPLAYTTRPKYLPAAYKADGTPDKRNDAWLRARAQFNRLFVEGAKDSRGVLIPGAIPTDEDGRWIMHLPLTAGRLAAMVVHGDLASLLSHAATLRSTEESSMRFLAALEATMPEIASVYRAASAYVRAMDSLDKAESRLLTVAPDKYASAVKRRDAIKAALYGDAANPHIPCHIARFVTAWHAALDIHDPSVKAEIEQEIAALAPDAAPALPPFVDAVLAARDMIQVVV